MALTMVDAFLLLFKRGPSHKHTHLASHTFNGPFPRTTRVSHQKDKTDLDFTEVRDSEWQWHQLSHMQTICTSLQTDSHASTPPLSFFTGQMPFLPPNQQRQSTEDTSHKIYTKSKKITETQKRVWTLLVTTVSITFHLTDSMQTIYSEFKQR